MGPVSVTFTHASFIDELDGLLFTVEPESGFLGWGFAATLMQDFWLASDGSPAASTSDPSSRSSSYSGPEQEDAVECAESPNPGAKRSRQSPR
jgi:hypothetical protein